MSPFLRALFRLGGYSTIALAVVLVRGGHRLGGIGGGSNEVGSDD